MGFGKWDSFKDKRRLPRVDLSGRGLTNRLPPMLANHLPYQPPPSLIHHHHRPSINLPSTTTLKIKKRTLKNHLRNNPHQTQPPNFTPSHCLNTQHLSLLTNTQHSQTLHPHTLPKHLSTYDSSWNPKKPKPITSPKGDTITQKDQKKKGLCLGF